MSLSIQRSGPDVAVVLEGLTQELDLAQAKLVLRAAQHVVGEIRATLYETVRSGTTGQLARSFEASFVERNGKTVSAAAGSDLIYARIQDEGGTILPRTVKRLAVPLNDNGRLPIGKWPRHWAPGALTLIKSKRGNDLLAEIKGVGKRAKIIPRYALVKSVTLSPKGYLETAARRAEPGVEEILAEGVGDAADQVIDGAGGTT